jgi:hypothetical protein
LQGKVPLASGCLALFFVGRHERQTTSSVGQLTPLAFVAASDDPASVDRETSAYLGLVNDEPDARFGRLKALRVRAALRPSSTYCKPKRAAAEPIRN